MRCCSVLASEASSDSSANPLTSMRITIGFGSRPDGFAASLDGASAFAARKIANMPRSRSAQSQPARLKETLRCDERCTCLTPRERIGGALEAHCCVAQLLDDALEIEELTLPLDGALIDASLLRGHVREDRFGVAGPEVERAERRDVAEQRADLRFLQQRPRAH